MNDKETIEILTRLLTKYPLDALEQEGVREAIGILSWTKLLDGYQERRKQARDRKQADTGNQFFDQ
jgi:hypothetical protein